VRALSSRLPSDANRHLLPAYAASLVASVSVVASLTMSLDPTPYSVCVFAFLLLGYAASAAPALLHEWAAKGVRTFALAVTLVLIPVLSLWVSPAAVLPDEALDVPDLRTAILAGWLLVGLSFVVRSPQQGVTRGLPLAFLAVPSLTVFGVISTINPNPEIVVSFLLFLAATVFVVSYEQLLERGLLVGASRERLTRVVHDQALACGVLFGVVFVVACAGTVILGYSAPSSAVSSAVARIRNTGQAYFYQAYGSWSSQLPWFRVGAGPSPNTDTVLMTVRTDEPGLLRGKAYAQYTGRGWEDGASLLGSARHAWRAADGWVYVGEARRDQRLVSHSIETTVDMPSVLFSGGTPHRVRGLRSAAVRVDPLDSLQAQQVQYTGSSYTIQAMVPDLSEAALRRLTDRPSDLPSLYLSVPNSATAVHELAPQLDTREESPYEKAETVCQWLASHCTYDVAAPRVPATADVADYFLSKSHRGACDQFATAAALLCRAVGVPARLVIGYLLDERDPLSGNYVARERHAHAWIEVYLSRCGWVPLDPTAGSSTGQARLGLFRQLTDDPRVLETLRWLRRNAFWTVFAALAAYLVWLVVGGLREDRRAGSRPGGTAFSPAQRRVLAAYAHVCRALARAGLPRRPSQTPAEFLQAIRNARDRGLPTEFLHGAHQLTQQFSAVRYADAEPTEAAVRRAEELRRTLPGMLKKAKGTRRRGGSATGRTSPAPPTQGRGG